MSYPKMKNYQHLLERITEYSRLKHEYGSNEVQPLLDELETAIESTLNKIKSLKTDKELECKEPNELEKIRELRKVGPRRLIDKFDINTYRDKLEGAILARFSGCTLGAIVEFWSVDQMEKWAEYIGQEFPPTDYWYKISNPNNVRYGKSKCIEYTRDNMNGVPVDDDIVYTLLGLLIAEEHGVEFTTENVGQSWIKYLPYACTAEDIALKNLKEGVPALEVAEIDNPYCQWIGADIRSDAWAYMSPGYPEKAAELAYRDAYLSHRRNGIYGEMFFAAVQSAAFVVDNPVDAIKIGLTEIPKESTLYTDIIWALEIGKEINNYKDARAAVDRRFEGMSVAHTNINACLTVFGLIIGGTNVTKVISEIVAMGHDNDCTAATAGSIVGAIVGKSKLEEKWYKNFNNTVHSYLINEDKFEIDDLINRFTTQAKKVGMLE